MKYKVWYYYTNDIEGKMHSLLTDDLETYLHNNSYETGIEVFEIITL